MIDFLKGEIVNKHPTEVVLRVGGIGFRLQVPLSTFERLPASGETTLLTHLHVREDGFKLFGFATAAEREMFIMLISVSGVGPSIALTALSGSSVEQIREMILSEQVSLLTKIKGIGRKTAQRLVVELKENIQRVPVETSAALSADQRNMEDTILGLTALGYSRVVAQQAVARSIESLDGDAKSEDLLREALKHV